jgi:hypothetical protein
MGMLNACNAACQLGIRWDICRVFSAKHEVRHGLAERNLTFLLWGERMVCWNCAMGLDTIDHGVTHQLVEKWR